MKRILTALLILIPAAAQQNPAVFPGRIADDTDLTVASNRASTTLSAPLSAGDTTLAVTDTSVFKMPTLVTIDSEIIRCTGKTSITLTGCTRAFDGTAAAAHLAGRSVTNMVTAYHVNQLAAEVKAIESNFSTQQTLLDATIAAYQATIDSQIADLDAQIDALGVEIDDLPRSSQADTGQFNWSRNITGSFGSGSQAIPVSPCPAGITTASTDIWVYISGGTGTAEVAPMTATNCTPGANGTITLTLAGAHSGTFTMKSATAGIVEASNYLAQNGNGGGTISAPPGNFTLYAKARVRANQQLVGAGRGATKFTVSGWSSGAQWRIEPGLPGQYNYTAVTTGQNVLNVTMRDFTVDQGGVFLNIFGAIVSGDRSHNQTIENVEVVRSGEAGVGIGLMGGIPGAETTQGRVLNSIVRGMGAGSCSGGIMATGYGHVIAGNYLQDLCDEGIVLNGSVTDSHESTRTVVANNTVEGGHGYSGIHAENATEAEIVGNDIDGHGTIPACITVYPAGDAKASGKITITGNGMRNCGQGVYVWSFGSAQSTSVASDVTISSNRITGMLQNGIWLDGAAEVLPGTGTTTIVANQISNCGTSGVFDGIRITGNVTTVQNISLMGNTVNHCTGSGIHFFSYTATTPVQNISVIGNIATDTGTAQYAISGCTNASPIVCTTTVNHTIANGTRAYIAGVAGNAAANSRDHALWVLCSVTSNTVTLKNYVAGNCTGDTNSTGSGAYTTGGIITVGQVQQYGFAVEVPTNDNTPPKMIVSGNQFTGNVSYNSILAVSGSPGYGSLSDLGDMKFSFNATDDSATNMMVSGTLVANGLTAQTAVTGASFALSGGPRIISGSGVPNGSATGSPGDIYINTAGGAGTTFYVKESGSNTNTGWVGK